MRTHSFIITAAAILAGIQLTTAQITTSEIKTEDTGGVTTIEGNVGIGTTSPGALLSINNPDSGQTTINMDNVNTNLLFSDHTLTLKSKTGWNHVPYIQWITSENNRQAYLGWQKDYFNLTLENGYDFSINGGNVGIGTTNPFQKLSLIDGQLFIGSTSTNQFESGRLRFSEHSNSFIGGYIHYDGIGNVLNLGVHEASNSETNDDVNAISILRSNGNVGIGTENPVYKLDVNGWTRGERLLISNGNATSYIFNDATGQNLYIGSGKDNLGNKNEIFLYNYGCSDGCNVPRIRLLGDYIYTPGNIGIGTLSPSAKLDVRGSAYIRTDNDAVMTFDNTDNSWQYFQFKRSGVRQTWLGLNAGNDFCIYKEEGGNIILNGGNVGIGTTTPGYKLEVAGTVHAETYTAVTPPWSDFVFDDNFALRPLAEVEKFIKKNKHLPDIPSEKELQKTGLDLPKMDAKLLQKIEELTLYTIQQQKLIEKLAEQNEKLIKRIETIEKQ